MGRFVSATGQFLLATYEQFSRPPTGSSICPLTVAHSHGNVVYQSAFNAPVKESKVETAEDRDERYKVSGARSSKQSPQGAFDERQKVRPSAGTWGVSVSEVDRAGSRLVDESACPAPEGIVRPTGRAVLQSGQMPSTMTRDSAPGM
jgi:hypothetical protein